VAGVFFTGDCRHSAVSTDGPDQASPGPLVSLLLVAAAGLLVLYAAGIVVTDLAFAVAGPLTSLLAVAVVALWVRGYP